MNINLNGIELTIIEKDFEPFNLEFGGSCSKNSTDIIVNSKSNQYEQYITILHEIIHKIDHFNGLNLQHDIVYLLSVNLFTFIKTFKDLSFKIDYQTYSIVPKESNSRNFHIDINNSTVYINSKLSSDLTYLTIIEAYIELLMVCYGKVYPERQISKSTVKILAFNIMSVIKLNSKFVDDIICY